MIRFIANLSIRAKVLAAPAGLVVLLLALGGYAFFLLNGNEASVRRLNTAVTEPTLNILVFSDHARTSLADLYRLTSVAANENDDKKLDKMSKDEMANLDAFGKSFAPMKGAVLKAGVPAAKIASLETALAAYVKQAKFVADMASSDAASALTFMTGSQTKFAAMDKELTDITASLDGARRQGLSTIYSNMSNGRTVFIAVILAMAALGLIMAIIVARLISRPILEMTSALGRLADKDYGVAIPALGQVDEIGRMAKAVEILKERSRAADKLDEDNRKAADTSKRRAERLQEITQNFEHAVGSIAENVATGASDMHGNAELLATTATQTTRQCETVTAASSKATNNTQMVAAAAEELSASVAEIGRQVTQATKIAGQAVNETTATDASIQHLAEAAQKIGDVVKLINDIAGQTNLLALNATIEAARAGEAGKGFAVVASEVKSLATQTAKATEDIAAQVNAIQNATGGAVQAIKRIGGTIGNVNEIATAIASAVEQQGAATQEIARNVQEAAARTQEVSSDIGGVTEAAAKTGQSAAQLIDMAGKLAQQSDALRHEVKSFLTAVAAA